MALTPEKENYMLAKLNERRNALKGESGFTLIELLVVLIIIGVLLAIAIPSYLGFQKSAQQTAAAADVRSAIPDVEEWYADNNQSYTGMTAALLKSKYDAGLKLSAAGSPGIVQAVSNATGDAYCISAVDAGNYSHVAGPGGNVELKETTDGCAAGWTAPSP